MTNFYKINLFNHKTFFDMMNRNLLLLLLAIITSLGITSCGDDEPDPIAGLMVTTIEAKGTSFEDNSDVTSDLNGASSATDVALNATITITFDKEVTAATANGTNVQLSSSAGTVTAAVTASGTTVTVNPDDDFQRGTMYTLSLSGLTAADGGAFTAVTRSFTTEGRAPVVVPNAASMIAYWNFDGTTDDANGTYNADNAVALTYGSDRFGQANSTATFDGDETIIEVPDGDKLMDSDDFTLSLWVKTNSDGHVNADGDPANHFVLGMGAFFGFQFEIPGDWNSCKLAAAYEISGGAEPGESEDLWFNGSGEDNMNGGWQGWDFVADLTATGGVPSLLQDKWAHIICTYDAAEKKGSMYINGELMKSQDFDLWPDGAPKRNVTGIGYRGVASDVEPILAFGFIKSIDSPIWAGTPWGDYTVPTANHFKGDLDDVRIFSAPFSATDARDLYDAEKP